MIDPERDSYTKRLWINNFSVTHEYGSDPYYEIDVTPYDLNPYDLNPYDLMPRQTITWNASPDARVRTNNEKLNKACEEINRNLTKSILDKYDLSYIDTDTDTDTDTDMAATLATKEAFKNYILEGKKMKWPAGGYSRLFDNDVTFVPTRLVPKVKKIIHSGPCTIVFWEDNTKTVVRLEEGKEYDEYAAFTAALAKKCYGSNSQVHKILEKKTKRDLKEKIKNAKTVDLFPDIPEEKKKASREAAIKRRDGEL